MLTEPVAKPFERLIPQLSPQPLIDAIRDNSVGHVKALITKNPELINQPMANGELPLHFAVRLHQKEIVKTLLALHADETQLDSQNLTAFDHAAIGKDPKIAKTLLKAFDKEILVKIKENLKNGYNNLRKEIETNKPEFLNDPDFPNKLNARDENGMTPIEKAILSQDLSQVAFMIVVGADLSIRTKEGDTLLHMAAKLNNSDLILMLLDQGLDPNLTNAQGITPSHISALYRNLITMQMLVAHGAKYKEETDVLFSPFQLMMKHSAEKDPLNLNSGEAWLFLTTAAYWLSVGAAQIDPTGYGSYLPAAVGALGLLTSLTYFGPKTDSIWKKGATLALYMGLDCVPVLGPSLQVLRTCGTVERAYQGISNSYRNFSFDPWKALRNATVHTFNASHSVGSTVQRAYSLWYQSVDSPKDTCKPIDTSKCKDLNLNDLRGRAECGVRLDLSADKCREHAKFFFMDISNFKKEFHQAGLKMHPDKSPKTGPMFTKVTEAYKTLSEAPPSRFESMMDSMYKYFESFRMPFGQRTNSSTIKPERIYALP